MRIVGGKYRSRLIGFPSDENITRPTKDMVREGLFNALGEAVFDSVVLDLFAGSGSLGLEALSRGAKFAYFVDKSFDAIKVIKKNITTLYITNSEIINSDYLSALENFRTKNIVLDIIFLDPPYKMNVIDEIVNYVIDYDILSKNGIIVIETDYKVDLNDERFAKIKQYKYGKTYVTIKRRTLWK